MTKHVAFLPPVRRGYSSLIALSSAGTADLRTSEIVQPPKPPPVIREPKTPETPIAISTKASSSGHETSYSSRSEACDRSMSAPTLV